MLTLLSVSSSVSTALAQGHGRWRDLKTDISSVVLEGWEVQARVLRGRPPFQGPCCSVTFPQGMKGTKMLPVFLMEALRPLQGSS